MLLVACLSGDGEVETAVSEKRAFDIRLDFKGELKARLAHEIVMPPVDGRPKIEWIIEDGSRVEAGDALVRLDVEDLQKQLLKAQSALAVAQTRLDQQAARQRLAVGAAEQGLALAALDAELAELRVTDSETVPLVQREQGKVAAAKAHMATDDARTGLERVRLDNLTEVQLLELESEKMQRQVTRIEDMIEASTLTAPGPGLVVIGEDWEGKYEAGSTAWPGAILLELPDLAEMEVVGWVHEVDSPQLALEQRATIVMDAHPSEPSEGTVVRIGDLAVPRGESRIKHLRVVLELDETTDKMKPGMTVGLDLAVDTLEDVVVVPATAVRRSGVDQMVHVRRWGGWEEVPIEVLGRHEDLVAVSGVEGGEVWALEMPR